MIKLKIDLGYSSSKIEYEDRFIKIPTAVSFYTDLGINYGDDNSYEFEGDRYMVGEQAISEDAFSTTDYKFIHKFIPLIIYHILNKLNVVEDDMTIELRTGLAIVDWGNKDEIAKRISKIVVNNRTINVKSVFTPQGGGVYKDWLSNNPKENKIFILDIGYNTINGLYFENGKNVRNKTKSYPGHGVSTIVKPFTNYLEATYKMPFSEQESIKIFLENDFKMSGIRQDKVLDKIQELKKQFVTKLFKSILVEDKKTMSMSDKVVIAGGGAYLLDTEKFPHNIVFAQKPYEFANVRGF
jgi:hypothetical protein